MLLGPVAAGKINLCVIAGVVPLRLTVDPAQLYDHAGTIPGNTI